MKSIEGGRSSSGKQGNVLIAVLGMVLTLGGVVATFAQIVGAGTRMRVRAYEDQQALYAAEAGLSESFVLMTSGESGKVGSEKNPVEILGGTCYVEETELGNNLVSLISTASKAATSQVEVIVRRTTTASINDYALASKRGVRLNSNVLIDSFDSSAGSYPDQVDGDHANESGSIASNDSVVVSSNTDIYGGLSYGTNPMDFPLISANATVSGAVASLPEDLEFPGIELPEITLDQGDLELKGGSMVLAPGDHRFDEVVVDKKGTLKIVGPSRVVMTSFLLNQNCTWEIDASGGEVEIFVLEDFELQSNSDMVADAGQATDIQLNLLAKHDAEWDSSPNLEFNSNVEFFGTIYAPDAHVIIDSNFEIFGSIAAGWIQLSSNTQLHFDEATLTIESEETSSLEVVAWREISKSQVSRLEAERVKQ